MQENRNFYKSVMSLVIPMALQNLVNVGISSTDVIMLGRVGEKVLSGASLGSQVQFVMSLILFGITSGASVLVAQYWGKGDVRTIEKVLGIALKFSLAIGAVYTHQRRGGYNTRWQISANRGYFLCDYGSKYCLFEYYAKCGACKNINSCIFNRIDCKRNY